MARTPLRWSHAAPASGAPGAGAGDFVAFGLRVAGFAASTLLITWGSFVLLLLALGGGSLDGLMNHLANLSTRYIGADSGRVASFKEVLTAAQVLTGAAVAVLRRHHLPSLRPADRSRPND